MEELIIPAPAKINLALDIRGLLPDGYHQLEMIMQSINLHDLIYLKKTRKAEIKLSSTDTSLPDGPENLAYQAAELLLKRDNSGPGLEIFIQKNIPVAAGLAGGSTDAAAVLKGMNILFGLKIGREKLQELGASIGSDVPFCIRGGTVLARGRGDELYQLPDLSLRGLVLIVPPVRVSTAQIYQEYDRLSLSENVPVERLVAMIKKKREISWNEGWDNVLERVTMRLLDDIQEIKELLSEMGSKFCLMSGSGPAVFSISDSQKVEFIVKNWPRKKDSVFAIQTVGKDFKELWRKNNYEKGWLK
ncbi:MAG TPA: 4-(cytidine 5'-diphospho)-2-C-methyl-D-erythritol kinase [Halanaerobiales bacterium]|nr:4-(cytidine 5'-diphospho)-2-C-methyl-D-erythritol kinase [Halanaerobiales bacterium]